MSATYGVTAAKNIETLNRLIRGLGVVVRLGTDLNDFAEIVSRQPQRHKLAPAFDPTHSSLPHREVLWMACYKNSELVGTQAIKLLDFGMETFEQFLPKRMGDIHPFGMNAETTNTHCFLSEDAKKISGHVGYHGELWLKSGPNGVRGGSLATLVTRLMLLESLRRWSPDFMIGFQLPKVACSGLGIRQSYMRIEQRSVIWEDAGSHDTLEGWLVWMSGAEAAFNLRIPALTFFEMFEEDDEVRKEVLAKVA